MEIVANASPLIGLARINKFYLLKELFGKVYIPAAVYQEVVIAGENEPGADETKTGIEKGWIEKEEVKDTLAVESLLSIINIGEAEAIILARELKVDRVLLDDLGARDEAHLLGLKVTGTIGILQLAMDIGMPISLKRELDNLKDAGFRISDELYQKVLGL